MAGCDIKAQLELVGLDEALRLADAAGGTPAERTRLRRRVEVAAEIMSVPPGADELGFLHSGLCQCYLPRTRPAQNSDAWARRTGRFRLLVEPGTLRPDDSHSTGGRWLPTSGTDYVGVPFGTKARLLMFYLQREGVRSRTVPMGSSMSGWMRTMGLRVIGGERGTIAPLREQALRLASCHFTLEWDGNNGTRGGLRRFRIASGMESIGEAGGRWPEAVELSQEFRDHLRSHAVPLDSRAIAHLSGSALALDLYAFLAHRLPRLRERLRLSWSTVTTQFGTTDTPPRKMAQLIRDALVEVQAVYPDARVEAVREGLLLQQSPPSVPARTLVAGGLQLISSNGGTA
jgi:Plasmid encoded RepA protein